jgi:hypothetical protein
MGIRKGKQGTSTAGVEYSPEKVKRIRRGRKRQEKRWASKASEVTTRTATPEEIKELLGPSPGRGKL